MLCFVPTLLRRVIFFFGGPVPPPNPYIGEKPLFRASRNSCAHPSKIDDAKDMAKLLKFTNPWSPIIFQQKLASMVGTPCVIAK